MDCTFVASEEDVMGYHSHHMSLHQVPNGRSSPATKPYVDAQVDRLTVVYEMDNIGSGCGTATS
jgi:hypothetical protein